jgi:hypothetical protein
MKSHGKKAWPTYEGNQAASQFGKGQMSKFSAGAGAPSVSAAIEILKAGHPGWATLQPLPHHSGIRN